MAFNMKPGAGNVQVGGIKYQYSVTNYPRNSCGPSDQSLYRRIPTNELQFISLSYKLLITSNQELFINKWVY